jgi:hypothetical protein
LQTPVIARPGAHPLYRVHHIGLLLQERISQVCGPPDVAREHRHGVGKRDQSLNARVPIHLLGRIDQLLAMQIPILLQPLPKLDNFQRIRAGREHLSQ